MNGWLTAQTAKCVFRRSGQGGIMLKSYGGVPAQGT